MGEYELRFVLLPFDLYLVFLGNDLNSGGCVVCFQKNVSTDEDITFKHMNVVRLLWCECKTGRKRMYCDLVITYDMVHGKQA